MLRSQSDAHSHLVAQRLEEMIWNDFSDASGSLGWFSILDIRPGQIVSASEVRVQGDVEEGDFCIAGLLEFGLYSAKYPGLSRQPLVVSMR